MQKQETIKVNNYFILLNCIYFLRVNFYKTVCVLSSIFSTQLCMLYIIIVKIQFIIKYYHASNYFFVWLNNFKKVIFLETSCIQSVQ